MKKSYVILGRGPSNNAMIRWSQEILAQNKWKSDSQHEAPYSSLSEQHVTFLFAGFMDDAILSEKITLAEQDGSSRTITKGARFQEIVQEVAKKYNIPPLSLRVKEVETDMVTFGDSNNCIAIRLHSNDDNDSKLNGFHEELKDRLNDAQIFPEKITDRFAFKIHISLGYKRMGSETFKKFEAAIQTAIANKDQEKDKAELLQILENAKTSPLSQLTLNSKKDLIRLGVDPTILDEVQRSLAISSEELVSFKKNFANNSSAMAGLQIDTLVVSAREGTRDTELFTIATKSAPMLSQYNNTGAPQQTPTPSSSKAEETSQQKPKVEVNL